MTLETTVAEPEIQIAPRVDIEFERDEDLDADKPWHVVLLDDDHHIAHPE